MQSPGDCPAALTLQYPTRVPIHSNVDRPIQFIRKQAFASDSSFISSTTARKEVQAADVQGRQLKPLTRTAYRRWAKAVLFFSAMALAA